MFTFRILPVQFGPRISPFLCTLCITAALQLGFSSDALAQYPYPSPYPSPTPEPTYTYYPSPTPTPSPEPTYEYWPSPSPTPTIEPTYEYPATPTPSPTPEATETVTPSPSPTPDDVTGLPTIEEILNPTPTPKPIGDLTLTPDDLDGISCLQGVCTNPAGCSPVDLVQPFETNGDVMLALAGKRPLKGGGGSGGATGTGGDSGTTGQQEICEEFQIPPLIPLNECPWRLTFSGKKCQPHDPTRTIDDQKKEICDKLRDKADPTRFQEIACPQIAGPCFTCGAGGHGPGTCQTDGNPASNVDCHVGVERVDLYGPGTFYLCGVLAGQCHYNCTR